MSPTSADAEMPEDVFAAISQLGHSEAGLMIPASKRALVQSRISRRLRALGLSDFREYLALVMSGTEAGERRHMVSALTTNVSSFFRESHHFETLAKLAPGLIERARAGEKVRLWSAGCSTGQEPYSIAMTLLEADSRARGLDIRILASDIDPAVLSVARRGAYDESLMSGVPAASRSRHFQHRPDRLFEASAALREMISFRELNLLGPWPMAGRFDAIFCRNVVIYFDEATQAKLWPRFREALVEDGMLFVGHSERVPAPATIGFRASGVTTYSAVNPATAGNLPAAETVRHT
jgi:chemotaxis protein methyltransferase CheR